MHTEMFPIFSLNLILSDSYIVPALFSFSGLWALVSL